ncbi:glycoside hydrolase family 30 protein [Terriglobus sp.]|uniref:glycoside hydrolase family 30 protein n=1 Tax=Terriglobus sp. TaxID=1889013 RepID=UPI003B004F4F
MEATQLNRRWFVSAATFAALSQWLPASEAQASSVQVFVTDAKRRHEAATALAWQPASTRAADATIRIDTAERFQPMLGFGAAFTDASCFVLQGMSPAARQALMHDLFSPKAMNLSVGRCAVGASDYSRDLFNYDHVAGDTGMAHFSTAHDDAYILPTLRAARAIQPDLFLLSSTWSPPGWMKVYGTMLGGFMSSHHLQDYARYYVAFLESYAAKGVPIQALTTGNEVEVGTTLGSMPATFWTAEMEADFIRDYLAPLLRERNLGTQIWLLDHNYDLYKRVLWQLQDPQLRRAVQGVAWHGYLGTPDMMSKVAAQYPDLPMYWTEGGSDITNTQYEWEWTRWGNTFTSALRNGCRCVIAWNLALDPNGQPNIGPFSCAGMVTIDGDKLRYGGQYWAMRHLSQHLRRGDVRVGSHSDSTDLSHLAFTRADGSGTICVLTNSGAERSIVVQQDSRELRLTLPENSITTLVG